MLPKVIHRFGKAMSVFFKYFKNCGTSIVLPIENIGGNEKTCVDIYLDDSYVVE